MLQGKEDEEKKHKDEVDKLRKELKSADSEQEWLKKEVDGVS
jgi:hypothetical protein